VSIATVIGTVSTACPTSASGTGDVTATLSAVAARGSAAAAVASATAELTGDKASLQTAPSADNCDINLGHASQEVKDACSIQSDDADVQKTAQKACDTATAQALSKITPVCGAVADVKKANSAAFATGVSQVKGPSCTDATDQAFNTVLFNACNGGAEFAPFVESPACNAAKATVIGLVSIACPTS
jgi:hypothetical protein